MGYLYRHIRLDKNEPFYIGIGGFDKSDNDYKRAYDSIRRNNIWKKIVSKTEYRVEIVLDDLSFDDVCNKEIEFIKIYGRIDKKTGCLSNMTDGESGYGRVCSEDTKEKLRNREVTDKMINALNRSGTKHSDLSKIKMRNNLHGSVKNKVEVVIDGITYDSYNDASMKFCIPLSSLYRKYKNK